MMQGPFLRQRFLNPLVEVQEVIELAYRSNEFYREKWRQAKLRPEEIEGADDLVRLPLTTSEEIKGKPWILLTVPRSRICQIHVSTPPTAPRLYIPLSEDDLYRGGIRPFTRGTSFSPPVPMIISEEQVVINALPYEMSDIALLFHRILQNGVGAGVVPVGKGGFYSFAEKSLQITRDLKADHIMTTPSYAIYLAHKAHEMGYEMGRDLQPKSLWLMGESCSPNLRRRIEALWRTQAFLALSSLEAGPIALECQEKSGLHVATGYIYPEIIPMSDSGLTLPEGAGEIVITVLWRKSSPVVRYKTGIMGCLEDAPCPCGLDSPRILCLGNRREFLALAGSRVSLLEIEDCLMELPDISSWYHLRPEGDSLTVLIPAGMSPGKREELRQKVEANLQARLRLSLSVKIQEHSRAYQGGDWERVLAT
ncbi:MAG: phenylacetate--CoA ligase family protein [Candidatus Binatia bacterium]